MNHDTNEPQRCALFYVLILLIAHNLTNMVHEKTSALARDIRFWLVLASFILLIWMTMKSYPV